MKKLISTVTALTFVLGLTAAGFAQTAAKEGDKPAVKMETKTGQALCEALARPWSDFYAPPALGAGWYERY